MKTTTTNQPASGGRRHSPAAATATGRTPSGTATRTGRTGGRTDR